MPRGWTALKFRFEIVTAFMFSIDNITVFKIGFIDREYPAIRRAGIMDLAEGGMRAFIQERAFEQKLAAGAAAGAFAVPFSLHFFYVVAPEFMIIITPYLSVSEIVNIGQSFSHFILLGC